METFAQNEILPCFNRSNEQREKNHTHKHTANNPKQTDEKKNPICECVETR